MLFSVLFSAMSPALIECLVGAQKAVAGWERCLLSAGPSGGTFHISLSRVALEMFQVPPLFLEIVKAAPTTLYLSSLLSVEVASHATTPWKEMAETRHNPCD